MKAYIDKCHPSHDQRRFTYLRRDRVVVEDAYGPLKGRWWCLSRRNDCEISDLPELITACCILHKGPQVPHVELPLVQLFFSTQETMLCFFPCGREWNFQNSCIMYSSRPSKVNVSESVQTINHSLPPFAAEVYGQLGSHWVTMGMWVLSTVPAHCWTLTYARNHESLPWVNPQ